ncbi:MAG: phage protease [Deltaproteobacteria bacterium]|nr:phage protease [Deltaproteobacteria bacterium]
MTITSNAVSQDQAPALPEWIRVLPRGVVELSDHREPFVVDETSLQSMAADFRSRGVDLVIDYEHQSLQGERAPAAGWIKELEARGDGLWARVDWTQQARDYLEKKEYRYFSPVLRLDPETRRPVALMHMGLTNVPAIKHLPPLVARWGGGAAPVEARRRTGPGVRTLAAKMESVKEKAKMVEQLKRLMGLEPEVEEGAVCGKAMEAFRDLAATLNLPDEVSVAQLKGAVEALKAGAMRLLKTEEALQTLKGRLASETADRLVEEALKAGKVSPAQHGWALEYCRRDPEGFRTYADRAPKLVPLGEELQLRQENQHDERGLLPEELAVCRSLNVSPEAYLKAKVQTG